MKNVTQSGLLWTLKWEMFVAQPQISFPQTCSGPGWRVQVWQYLSYNLDHLDVYLISPWMKMSKSLNYLSYNLDPLCLWCSGKPFCPLSHKAQSLPGKQKVWPFQFSSSSSWREVLTLIVVESLTKKTPLSFSFWRSRVALTLDNGPWYHLLSLSIFIPCLSRNSFYLRNGLGKG